MTVTTPEALAIASGSPLRRLLHTFAGGLPRTFWTLFAGQLVNRLGNMVMPMLVFYLAATGLSNGQVGLVRGALGVGALISQPLGGWLADRYGRKTALIAGLLSTAAGLAFIGSVRGVGLLLVAAAVLGAAGDIYRPAAAALVADIVPAADRPKAFGLLYWALNLGFAIASVAAGFLAAYGYWLLFVVDATAMVAFAAVIWVGIPAPAATRNKATTSGSFRVALRDRLLISLTALNLLAAIVYMQVWVTVPMAMVDSGLSVTQYGAVLGLNGILIITLQPLITPWLNRFPPVLVMATSWALLGVGIASTALADTTIQYAATVVLWTAAEVLSAGIWLTLVAQIAPDSARGRYQGVAGWSWSAAGLIGPVAGALVYSTFGGVWLWGGIAVIGIAAGAGLLALAPLFTRRAAATMETASAPIV